MKQKNTLAVLTAGTLWGFITVFVHILTNAGLSSFQIGIARTSGASILMIIFLLLKNPHLLKIHLRHIWYFIGTGIISLSFFNFCYFTTIIKSQTSIAVLLLYTSPIFVMLFSALLFKEKLTKRKLLALFFTFFGCALVSGVIGGNIAIPSSVLLTGIASGFFYALYSIFARFALKHYVPLTVTTYTFIFAALGTLPLGNPTFLASVIISSSKVFFSIIGICFLCTILPYLLYTFGLNYMQAGKAAIIVTVEPLVGSLIGLLVYSEPYNLQKIIGMLLILLSVILLNIPNNKQ